MTETLMDIPAFAGAGAIPAPVLLPVAAPPPRDFPVGDPASAALALLAALAPGSVAALKARIRAVRAEIKDRVEEARLRLSYKLTDFLQAVGGRVRLAATLEARLHALAPRASTPAPVPPAVEVCRLIRSVRR